MFTDPSSWLNRAVVRVTPLTSVSSQHTCGEQFRSDCPGVRNERGISVPPPAPSSVSFRTFTWNSQGVRAHESSSRGDRPSIVSLHWREVQGTVSRSKTSDTFPGGSLGNNARAFQQYSFVRFGSLKLGPGVRSRFVSSSIRFTCSLTEK